MAKATLYTPELIEEYTRKGYWDSTRLCDIWDRNAQTYPDKVALVDSKSRLTWAQAKLYIDRLALGLAESGIAKDELLAVQLPNTVELVLLRVACEKAGILCLPVMRTLRGTEMENILSRSEAVGLVVLREFRDYNYYTMINEIRPRLPKLRYVFMIDDDVPSDCISLPQMMSQPIEEKYPPDYLEPRKTPSTEAYLIAHTTGTTGFPKFVEYPMCTRIFQAKRNVAGYKFTKDDVFAMLGPASIGPNSNAYFAGPMVGATTTMLEKFDAELALQLIERERVTFVCGVPTILAMIVGHPNRRKYDTSSVRYWWSGGARLDYQMSMGLEKELGGVIIGGLGATDWGGECINLPDPPLEIRLTTVGYPIDETKIILVDDNGKEAKKGEEGEIWSKGPACVSGYFKDPEANKQMWTPDGWYKLGDLGRWDENGNLIVVGRKKDIIIRGGQNIYPAEIETLLLTHPKIKEVAVVGYPDPLYGERACAFVIPRSDQTFTIDEMSSFLKEKNIAPYKLPERLEIRQQFPLAGEQKIDKKVLRAELENKLKEEQFSK